MKTELHSQVLEAIERHHMLLPGDRVGVAVSGGADSVALLRLLEDLRATLGISLLVLHFHHGLRGAEADADQKFVAELAHARGLEFLAGGEDVGAWARAHRRNVEDAARHLRYEFFRRVVADGRARRVAVAHTADDQAETVLAHLLRGTGLAGLAGIHPVLGAVLGEIVRPLLDVRRDALREWLRAIGQPWCEDSTNTDTRRLRARLRIELVPLLERDFQPRVVERLGSLARLAHEEEAFWSALVEERFRALAARPGRDNPDSLELGIKDLLQPLGGQFTELPEAASAAFSRRLLRRIVEALAGDCRGFTSTHIEQVLHLARKSSSGRRVTLPRDLIVEKSFDRLLFSRGRRRGGLSPTESIGPMESTGQTESAAGTEGAAAASYEYVVELPERGVTRVTIPAIHRRLCLKVVDWPPAPSDTKMLVEALDADLLHPPFLLRNWQPGDSYCPRGHRRVRKVKFLFRESRIAARDRPSWPVLTSGGRVVWVPGLPAAGEFAACRNTRVALLISEEAI